MRHPVAGSILAALIVLAPSAGAGARDSFRLSESRTLREEVRLEGPRRLIVDNLFGDIVVTGGKRSGISVTAVETVTARNSSGMEQARREVSLRIENTRDGLVICADGPFRDPDDCTEWRDENRRRRDPDYRVIYDLEIRVPRDLDIELQTIEGDLTVEDVRGEFDVHGVNGRIEMSRIDGSGTARTVNGPVQVSFRGNPRDDSEFKTVNGRIDVAFREGLAADLSFETLNGEILTDFDYEALPPKPVSRRSRGASTTYRLDGRTSVRIASGGPRMQFKNINGDILVRKSQ